MVILGINTSHTATACLLKDGEVLACISEERLTRIKNQSGLPVLAVKECLRIANLKLSDIEYLVLSFKDPKVHLGFSMFSGDKTRVSTSDNLSFSQQFFSLIWHLKEQTLVHFPSSKYVIDKLLSMTYKVFIDPVAEKKLFVAIEDKLSIPRNKILRVDHHLTHTLAGYYGDPDPKSKPKLIFSLDSWGDGICATVNIAKNGKVERIAATPAGASIGDLYGLATIYLGMKGGEHEYKVMGLAPYASTKHSEKIVNRLKDLLWVNPDLTFSAKIHSSMFYQVLPKLCAYERFDNIAAAVQTLTEKLLCDWVKAAIKKTGVADIICTGGVFMNVKANQKIAELPQVKSIFVFPSCGDESTAFGAAYYGYMQNQKDGNVLPIKPLSQLYLGGQFSDEDIKKRIDKSKNKTFEVKKLKDMEYEIASLLAKGKIVARFSGRMEWGARALGNRSILANPEKLEVLATINDQIKSRDFWMPFAPSILEEESGKYFINKKKIPAPYMMMTFNATEEGRVKLKAAMHQYDFTLRPQVVNKDLNPSYYRLIQEFKKLTGIGGVLNTSFNLHGYPVVYSPEDAIFVFLKSKLEYLALGSYLLSKVS